MQIEPGRVVVLFFTITDVETDQIYRSVGLESPLAFVFGSHELPQPLQDQLVGLESMDSFDQIVVNAYGPPATEKPHVIPRRELPRAWRLTRGAQFGVPSSSGASIELFVHDVRGSRVHISPHHPWCGQSVRFRGKILLVRNPSFDERHNTFPQTSE